jgi:hypothetical protein
LLSRGKDEITRLWKENRNLVGFFNFVKILNHMYVLERKSLSRGKDEITGLWKENRNPVGFFDPRGLK